MKLDDLERELQADFGPMTKLSIGEEARHIPHLIQKYTMMYLREKRGLDALEANRDRVHKVCWDFYHSPSTKGGGGITDESEVEELGLNFGGELKYDKIYTTRTEVEAAIQSDKNWIRYNIRTSNQKEIVAMLLHLVKYNIREKNNAIQNSIRWQISQNGG